MKIRSSYVYSERKRERKSDKLMVWCANTNRNIETKIIIVSWMHSKFDNLNNVIAAEAVTKYIADW